MVVAAQASEPHISARILSCRCGTEVRLTLRWREMDSNFQYASTVRWHRATDLPLPPTVKRRSAGRPPPLVRPRSEAQRGTVRPAAAIATLAFISRPISRQSSDKARADLADGTAIVLPEIGRRLFDVARLDLRRPL